MPGNLRKFLFCGLALGAWLVDASPGDRSGPVEATDSRPLEGSRAGREAVFAEPFSVRRRGSDWWLVRPDGSRFFSRGVCCVDQGIPREQYSDERPGYAAWRSYDDTQSWGRATVERLRRWNFSTIGGWSDFEALRACRDVEMVFTPVLHLGSTAGVPWWDMWDPRILERMDQVAGEQIRRVRDDPRLMGYYSDNEMGWWNAALFRMTLEQAPASGQRRRLIELLKQHYHREWSELCRDFDPDGMASFEDLERGGRGRLYLRGGGQGLRVMRRFLGLAAERYYSLAHQIIRRHDPRGLILGDRYQSFYYPEVARASARFVDVVSCNLNAGWSDGRFPRYQLETLHALTRRPVLVSEFYLAARENRSGNENRPGFPVVDTQRERVAGFRRTLEDLAGIPYVVGADWFQYYDEPTFGRADGENYSFGLVDIHDRPYEELVEAASALDLNGIKARRNSRRPDASHGVPRAPPEPLAGFQLHQALGAWDREHGFVEPSSSFPLADLYVCWTAETLYLGVFSQDVVEVECYRDRRVPEEDRAEWIVVAGQPPRTIHARIGAGGEAVLNDPSVTIAHLSGVELRTRCIAAMAIPAPVFGRDRFRPGDRVAFTATFHTHGRVHRTDWGGRFRLGREGPASTSR